MPKKSIDERTHKQTVEASKWTAYLDVKIFKEAWQEACDNDSGLSKVAPENLPNEAKRAIVGLALRVKKLESEWS